MIENKSLLLVNRRSPYTSNFAKESLDVALVAAAFNQNTTLLFMDDGVFQLIRNQNPVDINQKNNSSTLPMLEMYEIKEIYVEKESMAARGLSEEDLLIPAELVDAKTIAKLLNQQQLILNF